MSARLLLAAFLTVSLPLANAALACPFCTAVGPTLAEEMASADVVVLARPVAVVPANTTSATRTFQVERVLRGKAPDKIEAPRVGETDSLCYIVGRKVEGKLEWSLPMETSPALAEYLAAGATLPAESPDRLQFFPEYLEHPDRLIADDAYNEFGKAPYEEVRRLKPHMHREKLLEWIGNSDITFVRRKLYFTMLGVCGTPEDAAAVRALVESPRPSHRNALDAALACYIALAGDEALAYVEEKFLRPVGSDQSLIVPAIAAIRFHGEELREIPRERLAKSLAVVLDYPPAADLVLADLARWGDWSHVDRLAELFVNCPADARHIRAPIARYLLACPLPAAAERVKELRAMDPAQVRQGEGMMVMRKVASAPQEPEPKAALEAPAPIPTREKPAATTPAKSTDSFDLLSWVGGGLALVIVIAFAVRLQRTAAAPHLAGKGSPSTTS